MRTWEGRITFGPRSLVLVLVVAVPVLTFAMLGTWDSVKPLPREVQESADVLRELCDPGWPVTVEYGEVEDDSWATSEWLEHDQEFRVLFHRRTPELLRLEVLAHEWAHLLAWDVEEVEHGPEWGEAYSRCYRALWEDEQ